MTKRLTQAQKTIKIWAEALRPFAEKHTNFDRFRSSSPSHEKGYEESYSDGGSRVTFQNLKDFGLTVDFEGGRYKGEEIPRNSGFVYARSILLFGEDDKAVSDNRVLAAKLVTPIFDWAKSIGLGAHLGYDSIGFNIYHRDPAILVRGELPAEKFKDYLALVGQIENHLDWNLKLEDERMDRPFRYAVVDAVHPEHPDMKGLTIFREIKTLEDLTGARFIVKLHRQLGKNELKNPYYRAEDWGAEDILQANAGKKVSVEEYICSLQGRE